LWHDRPMRAHLLAVALCALLVRAANGAPTATSSTREIYDVSLARTTGYLLSAHGRTVVETREECGGTRSVQRSLSDVMYKTGAPIRADFVTETWESSDHRALRFDTRNLQSGNGAERHTGTARLFANGTGQVTFASKDKSFPLPRGTLLPGAFSHAIIEAAEKGQDLENQIVFQGGERDALVTASVRIGPRDAHPHVGAGDPDHLLKGAAAWPVLMSYFPQSAELPASEVATDLYANGIMGSVSFVYPQYTLRATLVRVERLPPSRGCSKNE
jgi:EipB-like